MNIMTKNCLSALLVVSLSALYGCGGSSSGGSSGGGGTTFTGNSEPATVDEDNAEEIGVAAGEAVSQAASSSSLPISVELSDNSELYESINSLAYEASQASLLPSGIDVSDYVCTGGGSADSSVSGSGSTSGSGPMTTVTTFNNCSTGGYTITGTVRMSFDDIGDQTAGFTVEYDNVTVSGLGFGEQTLSFNYSCTNLSDFTTCSSSSVFEGSDGGSHQISDYSFGGDSSIGYSGNATFSHESYGSVSIVVTSVTYGSCGSVPDGGSISYSSSTGTSGEITFNSDCTVSGSWNNGASSGTF